MKTLRFWGLVAVVLTGFAVSSCGDDNDEDEKPNSGNSGNVTNDNPYNIIESGQVDLGLDVIWSATNLGASRASSLGTYYPVVKYYGRGEAFGNYRTGDGDRFYDLRYYYGDEDKDWDPATYEKGGKWRTPSGWEWEQLMNDCKWVWTSYKGTQGFAVIGSTGEAIFLPAYTPTSKSWHVSGSGCGFYPNAIDGWASTNYGDRYIPYMVCGNGGRQLYRRVSDYIDIMENGSGPEDTQKAIEIKNDINGISFEFAFLRRAGGNDQHKTDYMKTYPALNFYYQIRPVREKNY